MSLSCIQYKNWGVVSCGFYQSGLEEDLNFRKKGLFEFLIMYISMFVSATTSLIGFSDALFLLSAGKTAKLNYYHITARLSQSIFLDATEFLSKPVPL